MKSIKEYITEALSIRKLIQKFKRNAKEDTDKNAKTMEDARLAFYSMTKNSQGLISAKEAIHIIKDIRMKFKDADYMFGFGNDDIRGFLQGFLDYGWMNYKNYLEQDKFGEHCCDAAFNRCMKQTNERDRNIGLARLGRFFYGWDFAKELDLRISTHWMVEWNSDDPFKIVEDTKKTTSNSNESYKWTIEFMKQISEYITESKSFDISVVMDMVNNLLIDDRERIIEVCREAANYKKTVPSPTDIEKLFYGRYSAEVYDYFDMVEDWLREVGMKPSDIVKEYSLSRSGQEMRIEVIAVVFSNLGVELM